MNKKSIIKSKLIAPCGMNCGICIGHLRDKNKCLGCREMSEGKPSQCRKCTIMHCKVLKENKMSFCSDKCKKFPCPRLKNLDKRYRAKYNMSMLENLENIKKLGIREFVKNEKIRWACLECRGIICVHTKICSECGNKIPDAK